MFLILLLMHSGFRWLEALRDRASSLIAVCFVIELAAGRAADRCRGPGLHAVDAAIITNPGMLYIAIGILGATVMPHNLYLHSSIVQTRAYERTTPRASARRSGSPPSTAPWR